MKTPTLKTNNLPRVLFYATLFLWMLFVQQQSYAQSKIDAVFTLDEGTICFIKDNKVVLDYGDSDEDELPEVFELSQAFPGMPFKKIDAALNYNNGKAYFFSGNQYARYDLETEELDPDYPKSISKYWEGLNFDKIDAAIAWGNNKAYFFSGDSYVRYDMSNESVDENYPKKITSRTWPGLNVPSIDAAFSITDEDEEIGYTFFFKDDQYYLFNNITDQVEEEFPRDISLDWYGLIEALNGNSPKPNPGPNPGPSPTPTKGMDFFQGTWAEALAAAKAQNKVIFVDAFATWCGPCKRMSANVFPDAQVGAVYNQKFINVKFDMERGEGPNFARKYSVNAYPTLLFIDGNGKLVKRETGALDVPDFIQLGKSVSSSNGGGNNNGSGGNEEDDNGGIKTSYGSYNIIKKEIDLSPYKANSPSSVLADFMLKKGNNGHSFLGFQQKHDAIIMKINSNGERVGNPTVLKGYWLSDMLPMQDGSLALIAGKDVNNTYLESYPNTLYFMTISSSGSLSSPKHIFGGEGHGPQKSWFDGRSSGKITFNGSNFGIYFEVQKNWAEKSGEDIHNGDMFVVTDKNGNIDKDKTHFWTASHSSTIQTAAMANGEFYTMTIGDAHPYGLQVYNRDKEKSFIAWPPQEDFISYQECKSTNAAGVLRFMDESNGDLIAFMGTLDHPNIGWDTKVDPLFLKFDKSGKVIKKRYLTKTSDTDEGNISVQKLGSNYLVAYGPGNVYENSWKAGHFEVCIIDGNAKDILAPTKIAYPFGTNSQLVSVSDKKFVWCNAPYSGVSTLDWYEMVFK